MLRKWFTLLGVIAFGLGGMVSLFGLTAVAKAALALASLVAIVWAVFMAFDL